MQVNDLKNLMMKVGDARITQKRLEPIFPERTQATLEDFNKKYNMLTPIGVAGAFIEQVTIRHIAFICQCDCGNKVVVALKRLKAETSKSCGCKLILARAENGKKNVKHGATVGLKDKVEFRRNIANQLGVNVKSLVFVKYMLEHHPDMITVYPERVYKAYNPKVSKIKEEKIKYIKSDEEVLYRRYQKNAKARNLEFTLDIHTYSENINKPCFYCGEKDKKYSGLDRVDNNIGYIKENIVPCCEMCNFLKKNNTQKDFVNKCMKIAENFNNKQIQ